MRYQLNSPHFHRTKMAKKSLAEQIAELSKPKNDFDIENGELADPFQNDSEDINLDISDDELRKEHYVPVQKSKMRSENDKLVTDEKYTGKIADRNALFGEDEDDSEEAEEEEENAEDDENEVSDSGESLRANSDDESEPLEEEQEEFLEEEADIKRDKIKAMMTKERKHIVSRLSEAATQDALKGFAILLQHKMFDSLIDSRLKVQKALTNSNLLPGNKDTLDSQDLASKHTRKYLKKATDKCYDLLDTILELRSQLYTKESIVTEPVEHKPKKRSLDLYLDATTKYDSVLNKYRGTVLTKWLAKIQNTSGSSAMNASKFKALNQSAEQQVVNNLSDMDRLVKRTRLNRRLVKPLGFDYFEKTYGETQEQEDEEQNPDLPTQTRSLNVQEVKQIFDDEDFYRVLLNDLVDKKIQNSDPTSGLQYAMRGAAAAKVKKNVDSKASKGRKLRYHVQEPIANFETSKGSLKWDDDQIDEFFASLLGQKVNMTEEVSDEEEELVAGEDSIQLFG